MPDFIREALRQHGVWKTHQARLNQMLDELERGGVYMKIKWNRWRGLAIYAAIVGKWGYDTTGHHRQNS